LEIGIALLNGHDVVVAISIHVSDVPLVGVIRPVQFRILKIHVRPRSNGRDEESTTEGRWNN
jgi:hypothetical protein